jgi:hypothetical protein
MRTEKRIIAIYEVQPAADVSSVEFVMVTTDENVPEENRSITAAAAETKAHAMSAARTPPRSDTAAIPDITAIPAKAIIPAAVPPDAPVKEYVIRTAAMTAATKKIPVLSVLTFMSSSFVSVILAEQA